MMISQGDDEFLWLGLISYFVVDTMLEMIGKVVIVTSAVIKGYIPDDRAIIWRWGYRFILDIGEGLPEDRLESYF